MVTPHDPQAIAIHGDDSPFNSMASLIERLRLGMGVIGDVSVANLWSFLSGYAIAKANSGEPRDLAYFNAFGGWVRRRYKVVAHDWGKIIAFYSRSDAEGIALFWKLYDAFLAEEGKRR